MALPSDSPSPAHRASLRLFLTALAILVADQVVKKLVVTVMGLGDTVSVFGSVVRITRTENTGAAFGLMRGRNVVFIIVSGAAAAAIVAFRREIAKLRMAEQLGFALILGGALGNLVDRARLGAVVDFIDIGIRGARWPAFNVADSAITIGVMLLAVHFLFLSRPRVESGAIAEHREAP